MANATEVYSSTTLTLALDGGGCLTPRPGHFTLGGDPVAIVYVTWWAAGPVWSGAEKHASTGIRSPDRPARSESPYRLHCTGPHFRTVQEWTESTCVVILRDWDRSVRHASCTTFTTNPTRIALAASTNLHGESLASVLLSCKNLHGVTSQNTIIFY